MLSLKLQQLEKQICKIWAFINLSCTLCQVISKFQLSTYFFCTIFPVALCTGSPWTTPIQNVFLCALKFSLTLKSLWSLVVKQGENLGDSSERSENNIFLFNYLQFAWFLDFLSEVKSKQEDLKQNLLKLNLKSQKRIFCKKKKSFQWKL